MAEFNREQLVKAADEFRERITDRDWMWEILHQAVNDHVTMNEEDPQSDEAFEEYAEAEDLVLGLAFLNDEEREVLRKHYETKGQEDA